MLDSLCEDILLELVSHVGTTPRDRYAELRKLSCTCASLRAALRPSVADAAKLAAQHLVKLGAAAAPAKELCNLSHLGLSDFDAELLALAIAKDLLTSSSIWLQGNWIGAVGLNSLALGLRKAPETSPLRSLSLGGNEFHRALDAPAADVRARRSRRKAERALARAQQAARHRKVVLRPHS